VYTNVPCAPTNATLAINNIPAYAFCSGIGPVSCFRTIFTGNINNTGTSPGTTTTGQMNLGPVGLGYLALGNYIGDCSVFYCPTASTGMPTPGCCSLAAAAAGAPDSWYLDPPRIAAHNISDLKTYSYGGKLDALSIMRGNYNGLTANVLNVGTASGYDGASDSSGATLGANQNAVLSQYAYRDVPWSPNPTLANGWGPAYPLYLRPYYVSPALIFTSVDEMGPLFKTQKILGGRALAADAFGKNGFESASWAGPGYYGHRDGYNVLYGDWSTHWWGDPLQKFIWWQSNDPSQPNPANGGDTNVVADLFFGLTPAGTASLSATGAPGTPGSGTGYNIPCNANGAVIQWHMLDLANGIDNLPSP
jgi:hypothetical protein